MFTCPPLLLSSQVTNSQNMVAGITAKVGAIGYVESGQGVAAGLQEVRLVNAAGSYLTSTNSSTVIVTKALLDQVWGGTCGGTLGRYMGQYTGRYMGQYSAKWFM